MTDRPPPLERPLARACQISGVGLAGGQAFYLAPWLRRSRISRPVLGRVLERVSKRDTLVVTRIECLARSLSHLFEVIEHLDATSAFFQSVQDSTDALAPQDMFTLQVLWAALHYAGERVLISPLTFGHMCKVQDDPLCFSMHFQQARSFSSARFVYLCSCAFQYAFEPGPGWFLARRIAQMKNHCRPGSRWVVLIWVK